MALVPAWSRKQAPESARKEYAVSLWGKKSHVAPQVPDCPALCLTFSLKQVECGCYRKCGWERQKLGAGVRTATVELENLRKTRAGDWSGGQHPDKRSGSFDHSI